MFRWLRGTVSKAAAAESHVSQALAARSRGDDASVIAELEAALSVRPDHVDALRLLGDIESRAGRTEPGLAKLDRACLLQPLAGANHYAKYQVLLALDQPELAVGALGQAVSCPDSGQDWQIELGLLQERTGRATEALATWRLTAAKFPDEAIPWWNLAHALERADQIAEQAAALSALDRAARTSADSAFALGLFLQTEGPREYAARFYAIALEQNPDHRTARLNLGAVLLQHDDVDGAIAVISESITRFPDRSDGWVMRGSALRVAGRLVDAEHDQAHAVSLDPLSFLARVQYAITLERSGKLLEAEEQLHVAISLRPNEREPHLILGNVLLVGQLYDEAEAAYWRAIELGGQKGDVDALLNLSSMLHRQGRHIEAVPILEELLRIKPDFPEALCNLGVVFRELGRTEDAERCLRRALEIRPSMAEPHVNLSNMYSMAGRNTEAEASARAALDLEPDNTDALVNLGNALQSQGHIGEFVEVTRRALKLKPDLPIAWSNLLLSLNYSEDMSADQLLDLHRRYGKQFAPSHEAQRTFPRSEKKRKRKLKIGYVSPDFRNHVVAHFFEPVLEKHDRTRFDVHCYFCSSEIDATTRRIRDLADVWRELGHVPFDDAERMMLKDNLDVVIDLAGHTARNLLPVLARRVAPVQATWLGYPGGTGVGAMDWRITDRWADPAPDADAQHVERLYRLPDVFIAFRPSSDSPPMAKAAAREANGYVTFGSFNNFVKISDSTIRLWASILAAVPNARFAIKTLALRDEALKRDSLVRFERLGFDVSRLDLLGPTSSHRDHLLTYESIDVALDTFPYHGTTTTCEALWMGVPVVTLAGDRHAARVGVSLMTSIGCEQLIARSPTEYVAIAVALAQDAVGTKTLRQSLRDRLATSPLGDVARLTGQLESAYVDMHSQWLLSA